VPRMVPRDGPRESAKGGQFWSAELLVRTPLDAIHGTRE
jgi:hypothetical protein